MIESASLSDLLAAAIPEVYRDRERCARYAVHGQIPTCIAIPDNLDGLAAVLRIATTQQAVVIPWGGGTQQTIGAAPDRVDVVVCTERLSRVLLYEPGDMTISVEAGITLASLRQVLAEHNQMLPIDPPLPDQATLGGLIATATDGPRRLGYGTLRDLLIGITVVEAGGRISRGGGMVVKNVSGFDMMKLYHGSLGTLAVVAVANLKLLPAPLAQAGLCCMFENLDAAIAFIDALHLTQLTPTATEYLNGPALARLDLTATCAVVMRTEGLPAAVARHLRDLSTLADRHGAQTSVTWQHEAVAERWGRIADLPQVAHLAADEAVIKVTALPGELDRTILRLEQAAAASGATALISARALNGVIYVRLQPITPSQLSSLAATIPGIQWIASTMEGAPAWGKVAGLDVMRRIKREFDPLNILNPGRYVDGI